MNAVGEKIFNQNNSEALFPEDDAQWSAARWKRPPQVPCFCPPGTFYSGCNRIAAPFPYVWTGSPLPSGQAALL